MFKILFFVVEYHYFNTSPNNNSPTLHEDFAFQTRGEVPPGIVIHIRRISREFELSDRPLWIKLVQRHRYELELGRIYLHGVKYFNWIWDNNPWHPHYWNYLWFTFRTKLLNLSVSEDTQYAIYHTVTLHTPIIYEMQSNPGFFDTFYPELKVYLRHSDLFPPDDEEMEAFIMPMDGTLEYGRVEIFKQCVLYALLHLADGYSFLHKQEYQRKFCQVQWWNIEIVKLETFLVKRKSKTHWTTNDREPPTTLWNFHKKEQKGLYKDKQIGEGLAMDDALEDLLKGRSTKKMLESFYKSKCTADFEDEPDTRVKTMNKFGLPIDPENLELPTREVEMLQEDEVPKQFRCHIKECPDNHPRFDSFDELMLHYVDRHPRNDGKRWVPGADGKWVLEDIPPEPDSDSIDLL